MRLPFTSLIFILLLSFQSAVVAVNVKILTGPRYNPNDENEWRCTDSQANYVRRQMTSAHYLSTQIYTKALAIKKVEGKGADWAKACLGPNYPAQMKQISIIRFKQLANNFFGKVVGPYPKKMPDVDTPMKTPTFIFGCTEELVAEGQSYLHIEEKYKNLMYIKLAPAAFKQGAERTTDKELTKWAKQSVLSHLSEGSTNPPVPRSFKWAMLLELQSEPTIVGENNALRSQGLDILAYQLPNIMVPPGPASIISYTYVYLGMYIYVGALGPEGQSGAGGSGPSGQSGTTPEKAAADLLKKQRSAARLSNSKLHPAVGSFVKKQKSAPLLRKRPSASTVSSGRSVRIQRPKVTSPPRLTIPVGYSSSELHSGLSGPSVWSPGPPGSPASGPRPPGSPASGRGLRPPGSPEGPAEPAPRLASFRFSKNPLIPGLPLSPPQSPLSPQSQHGQHGPPVPPHAPAHAPPGPPPPHVLQAAPPPHVPHAPPAPPPLPQRSPNRPPPPGKATTKATGPPPRPVRLRPVQGQPKQQKKRSVMPLVKASTGRERREIVSKAVIGRKPVRKRFLRG